MRRVSKLVAVLAAAGMLFSGGGLASAADGVGGVRRTPERGDAAHVVPVAVRGGDEDHPDVPQARGDLVAPVSRVDDHGLAAAHVCVAVGLDGADHEVADLVDGVVELAALLGTGLLGGEPVGGRHGSYLLLSCLAPSPGMMRRAS